jgi:hypothetical protein
MRAAILVLLLVMAGCAQQRPGTPNADDQVMPPDFAGTVEYGNGSVAPPYHYDWVLRFDGSTAVVEWRPGYDSATEPWRETADITEDQRQRLYNRLVDLGVFDGVQATDDGMVGGPGGSVEVTARGKSYDPGSLGGSDESVRLLEDVADAVEELIPVRAWDGLRDKQDAWSEQQPK